GPESQQPDDQRMIDSPRVEEQNTTPRPTLPQNQNSTSTLAQRGSNSYLIEDISIENSQNQNQTNPISNYDDHDAKLDVIKGNFQRSQANWVLKKPLPPISHGNPVGIPSGPIIARSAW